MLKLPKRALNALAAAGYHGHTGASLEFAFKDDSRVKAGKGQVADGYWIPQLISRMRHSFRKAIKDVPGVVGNNCKSKVSTCEVTGDFDAAAMAKALNTAGFHLKVKQ